MSDNSQHQPAASAQVDANETAPAPKKKFNLQVKDLQLKQAPMEAVINRET